MRVLSTHACSRVHALVYTRRVFIILLCIASQSSALHIALHSSIELNERHDIGHRSRRPAAVTVATFFSSNSSQAQALARRSPNEFARLLGASLFFGAPPLFPLCSVSFALYLCISLFPALFRSLFSARALSLPLAPPLSLALDLSLSLLRTYLT